MALPRAERCHEVIGEHAARGQQRYCDLAAWDYCASCGRYICSIHRVARHYDHNVENQR